MQHRISLLLSSHINFDGGDDDDDDDDDNEYDDDDDNDNDNDDDDDDIDVFLMGSCPRAGLAPTPD